MKISSNKFNLQFFMNASTKVKDLTVGAKRFGGATKNLKTGETYSNYAKDEYIQINEKRNLVSIVLPTTHSVDKQATNAKIAHMIQVADSKMRKIKNTHTTQTKGIGSYYSEDLDKIINEHVILIEQKVDSVITENDIKKYIEVAEYIKRSMAQEAVAININQALLLA